MISSVVRRMLIAPFIAVALGSAQTKVDLQHQAKGVDFTASTYTKPIRMGSSLPASCMVGEAYLLSSAPAGASLYFCLQANQWTQQSLGYTPPQQPIPSNTLAGSTVASQLGNCISPSWMQVPPSMSTDVTWPSFLQNGCIVQDLRGIGSFTGLSGGAGWNAGAYSSVNEFIEKSSTDSLAHFVIGGWSRSAEFLNGGFNNTGSGLFKSNYATEFLNMTSQTYGQHFVTQNLETSGGQGDSGLLFGFNSFYGGSNALGDDGQTAIDVNVSQCNIGPAATANGCEFASTVAGVSGSHVTYTGSTSYMEQTRGAGRFLLVTNRGVIHVTVTSINYPSAPPVVTGSGFSAICPGASAPCTPANAFFTILNSYATDLTVDSTNPYKVTSATKHFASADGPPTVISVTGGTGWTTGFYTVTSAGSGYVILDHPPAAVGTTGGNFTYGGNVYGDPNAPSFVLQVTSIASDTSMTLGYAPQGANQTWPADAMTGTGTVYLGSTVTAVDPTGGLTVADGTQFQVGDSVRMPMAATARITGLRGVVSAAIPVSTEFAMNAANFGNRPAFVLGYLNGSSYNGIIFSSVPVKTGIQFVPGFSPLTGYFVTQDNVPNSTAYLIRANRNSGNSSWFGYDKVYDGYEASTNLKTDGAFYSSHGYIVNSESPYAVANSDSHLACDASSGNVVINLPSLQVAGQGGDTQNIAISKYDTSTNTCTVNASAGDHIVYDSGSKTSVVLTVAGQTLSVHGSEQAAYTWLLNAPYDGSTLPNSSASPMTTLGDLLYENSTPAPARLAGNISTTMQVLTQTGTGLASAAPVWTSTSGAGSYIPTISAASTFTTTAAANYTFPSNSQTIPGIAASQTWSSPGTQTFNSGVAQFNTGSGAGALRIVPGTAYTGSSDGFIGRNDATTPSLMQVFDSSTGIAKNITIPAYVAFTGTAASAAVSPAALFTPSSAALQIWDIKATINEVTAGTGCSGSYTVTITWNDGSANSYTLATVPWVSSISAASGSSLGTRAFGELVIQQASTASPTYAVSVPTGCTSMQYAWSVHAARLN